jgi:hypothetical protein
MIKRLINLLFACVIMSSLTFAQVMVDTYGVSPRQAEADSLDMFDLSYNGLKNVGTNTKVYLKGWSGMSLVAPVWTVLSKPAGSAADLAAPEVMDTSSEITSITPDLTGTYVIEFADGGNADTVTLNAGLYLGVDTGTPSCRTCHSGVAAKWEATDHATIFNKAMDGTLSTHYGPSCVPCHTTGYDANADNDGFDDRDWVYPSGPDSLNAGTWDLLLANSPRAMELANIQCESCHGPGSEHMADVSDSKMVSSLDVNNCATCHDSGPRHAYPNQWVFSGHDATEFDGRGFHGGHAVGAFVGYAGGRDACAACHSGSGYVQWVKEGKPIDSNGLPAAISVVPEPTVITCAACHDPHSNDQPSQLRLSDTQLGDGTPVTVELYGTGAQCMECHRSRREAASYSLDPSNASSHYGPHHGPQADMLIGANVPDFGFAMPSSPHARIPNSCVSCHMYGEGLTDAEGNILHVGGHSFNMNDAEGNDHVAACEPCHGDVGETFKEKKFYWMRNADHDGDGVEEGLQVEVKGMMEELLTFLPQDAEGNVDLSDKTNSPQIMRAGYVYMWIYEDRSFGIHNPAMSIALLKAAIESLKYDMTMAGQIQSVTDIPMDQGFQVRVVWTKFAPDANNSTDKIDSYAVLRAVNDTPPPGNIRRYSAIDEIPGDIETGTQLMIAEGLWDIVAVVPAMEFMEYSVVVPTLHNDMETMFKVLGKTESGIVAETEPMAGMSTDDLAPAVPGGLAAAAKGNGIELTWEEAVDADFKYFSVYRSETQGFEPTESELIANTAEASYVDNSVVADVLYYYVLAAVDFSDNMSEFSNEVAAILTDVRQEGGVPTEFALNQNYPNPFNPSTAIKFAVPKISNVKIAVYDITGREIATIVDEQMNAGYYSIQWNASNIASGIYFYKLQTEDFVSVKKMILLK